MERVISRPWSTSTPDVGIFAVEGTTNDGHAFDGSFTLDVVE